MGELGMRLVTVYGAIRHQLRGAPHPLLKPNPSGFPSSWSPLGFGLSRKLMAKRLGSRAPEGAA